MIARTSLKHATICAVAFFYALPAAAGCAFTTAPVVGDYGGYTFYQGLMHQFDPETGKTLNANQAITVRNIADCAQVCLDNPACTGVTYRRTSSGQCLTFAAFDFETNRHMGLKTSYSSEIKASSALIREYFQGPICR